MAASISEYEENIKKRLSLNITFLDQNETNEFNRIIEDDLKPAFLEEAEKCRWNVIHAKRKEKGTFSSATTYRNKYNVDYKRKEDPFFVLGINECYQELKNDNLRILLYNKIGVRYCLGDTLLALCLSKQIPIIPVKADQKALMNLTCDSKKPIASRTSCIGITKKSPPSRSLLSSLIYLEKYYRDLPHISFNFISSHHKIPAEIICKTRQRNKRIDREKKRHDAVYERVDGSHWMKKAFDSQWIASLQQTPKNVPAVIPVTKPAVIPVTKPAVVPVTTITHKLPHPVEQPKVVPTVPKDETPKGKKEGIEKSKGILKTKSLKDRLKSNPLFRYK